MTPPRTDAPYGRETKPRVTPAIAAEAAVWVTRLHGPDRSPKMESEFKLWQAQSPAHREAFEKCTDAWIDVEKINLATAYETVAGKNPWLPGGGYWGKQRWAAVAVSMAVLGVGIFVGQRWWGEGAYATEVGEQRVVMLEDGTRMLLNTGTRLRVNFSAKQRTVSVGSGEAIFEVAKDAARPFVVRVSGSEVVAVGTAFSVRYGEASANVPSQIAITLIEGRISVRPAADGGANAIAPASPIQMTPGERLRLDQAVGATSTAAPKVDRPNVDQVTAWKRSEAVFDATGLSEAVAEMNRYSRTQIVLVGTLASTNLRVSGLYRTGDNVGFANAVASLHGLTLKNEGGRLELRKAE